MEKHNELKQYRAEERLHIHSGKSHKREFHGAWLTLGGFVRETWGWWGVGETVGLSAQRGGYIYQTSWSGGVKHPPGATSAVSVSVSGSKAKIERFTAMGSDNPAPCIVIDPEDSLK